jgi:hypothetical protein
MGFFSWKTQDTNKSIANIHSGYSPFLVCMHDDKGNIYTEPAYDGYGVFGNKDFYELLAEMNGLLTRIEGIELAHSGKPYLSPNLTEAITWEWIDEAPSNCEHQGFFYDQDLEEGPYDDGDEWGDWEEIDEEEEEDIDDPAMDAFRDEERNFIDDEREREREDN